MPLANPTDYIVRFVVELKVTGTTARKAIDLVNEAKQNGLTAAAIYIAGILEGERRTQREIAETAAVTEITVRNRYKELVRKLEISITI
ncbi:MAG: hypothetical protein ACXAB7_20650 [Candidatus Kariarchaeaceae archaeon]